MEHVILFFGCLSTPRVRFTMVNILLPSSLTGTFRIKNLRIYAQVPHSHCSPRENIRFLQKFKPKNSTLREIVWLIFLLNICIVIEAWHSKIKTITLILKIVCISHEKIPKTCIRNASELCEWGTRSQVLSINDGCYCVYLLSIYLADTYLPHNLINTTVRTLHSIYQIAHRPVIN
jgi:hypothetical protein